MALQLLTRVAHPHDRRSLLLVLMPSAEEMTQKIYDDFQALIARAARDVSPVDQDRLAALLTSIARTVVSEADLSMAGPASSSNA